MVFSVPLYTPFSANSNLQTDFQFAHDYVIRLSQLMASNTLDAAALDRLRIDLLEAIEACDLAERTHAPSNIRLDCQSHVLWLCNQCDYYLINLSSSASEESPFENTFKKTQTQPIQQLRAITIAAAHFQILAHIRRIFLGKRTTSVGWKDILPGIMLWLGVFFRQR